MNIIFVVFAEMDSPISITEVHPYGRRRGANGRTGAVVLKEVNMFICPFISGLKVQINSN